MIFTPDLGEVEPIPTADAVNEANDLPECRVEFREWLTLPHMHSPKLDDFRLSEDVLRQYSDFYFGYDSPKSQHQILGHEMPIQTYPAPEGRPGWQLLSQFGQDQHARLETPDSGSWYFMTHQDDMKKANFDDTYTEFQTG